MRALVRDFVRIVAETLPAPSAVLEVGSFRVPGQEELADLRPFFKDSTYMGCDLRRGLGVDCVADVCAIPVRSGTVDMVLMLDTLEHVEFPREAIRDIYRALVVDGMLVMSSVMYFPIHEYPSDYWRFTPQGFESLLKAFAWHYVWALGDDDTLPHTVLGIGLKSQVSPEVEAEVGCAFKTGTAVDRSVVTVSEVEAASTSRADCSGEPRRGGCATPPEGALIQLVTVFVGRRPFLAGPEERLLVQVVLCAWLDAWRAGGSCEFTASNVGAEGLNRTAGGCVKRRAR